LICYTILKFCFYSGKCACALFGDYVGELRKKMGKAEGGLPMLVVQFAKVKIFRGNRLFKFVFMSFSG
jgi:hypothetical protein